MSTPSNILTQPNQCIEFQMEFAVTSISSLDSYTDDTQGEDVDKYFDKHFQYSIDTISWSEWIPLTNTALQQVSFEPHFDVMLRFRYTRVGSEGGQLVWNWTNIQASKVNTQCGPSFNNSIFSVFFECCCNSQVLKWCSNVVNKLYGKGILMQAMTRNENNNRNDEDRDFIDFWRTVSCYFAMIVSYARVFEDISQYDVLLRKHMQAKQLFINNVQSSSQMKYIYKNRFRQIRQRGSLAMLSSSRAIKQSNYVNGLIDNQVDGELLRMISFNQTKDEFLFTVSRDKTIGWIVNQHSPLYKGIQQQPMLVKLYNIPTQWIDAQDIYPLINPNQCSVSGSGDDVILTIDTPQRGQVAGIGIGQQILGSNALFEPGLFEPGLFEGQVQAQIDYFNKFTAIVDHKLGYQLTFYVKTSHPSIKISCAVNGFDLSNNVINPQVLDIFSTSSMSLQRVSLPKTDQWYFCRVNIYPSDQAFSNMQELLRTSLLVGNNIKLSNMISKLSPQIVLDNSQGDVESNEILQIKQVKLMPLKTGYGKGLIQGQALIETWIKNNSLQFEDSEISRNIKNNMIPYKMGIINNFI